MSIFLAARKWCSVPHDDGLIMYLHDDGLVMYLHDDGLIMY